MEKKYFLNAPQQSEGKILDSLFAEMVLDKALHNFRKKQIKNKIDESLRNKNKEEFLRLTEELKNIS
ncbi:IDEAL domain-containing protein [Bacillus methanolicus]|uniref:IDEAL domain-containing protein n=1 Tax=Bacillus methanolicus (strain MGA3 / ATCC 53907) TaxID=796606 RepID=I3ECF3_BACMM|nr:IDEAL domain-containing protein [Bacillus methanolicus]AIE61051.1 hypothetical protein BMMGA3_13305 [Bacillus methanolicus MGA3]EIJ84174.1 IDEAL domain-containing protein [Bacillus methanolicus MGA3]